MILRSFLIAVLFFVVGCTTEAVRQDSDSRSDPDPEPTCRAYPVYDPDDPSTQGHFDIPCSEIEGIDE